MTAERYLLDTSALLTLIEDEEGADRVQECLRAHEVIVPWVVLMEVHYVSRLIRGRAVADHRFGLILRLPVSVLWEADERIALTAARFKAEQRVSLADAMIAAYSQINQAVLVHKDPDFELLRPDVDQEPLPYKEGAPS